MINHEFSTTRRMKMIIQKRTCQYEIDVVVYLLAIVSDIEHRTWNQSEKFFQNLSQNGLLQFPKHDS